MIMNNKRYHQNVCIFFKHLAIWTDSVSTPCRPVDKSAQPMYHDTPPNRDFAFLQPIWTARRCRASIPMCCPAPNWAADRSLWVHRPPHGRQRISHEWFSRGTCWGPEWIPFAVSPCCRRHLGLRHRQRHSVNLNYCLFLWYFGAGFMSYVRGRSKYAYLVLIITHFFLEFYEKTFKQILDIVLVALMSDAKHKCLRLGQ